MIQRLTGYKTKTQGGTWKRKTLYKTPKEAQRTVVRITHTGGPATGVALQEVTKDDTGVTETLWQPQEGWPGEEGAMIVSTTAKKGEKAEMPRKGVVRLEQGEETTKIEGTRSSHQSMKRVQA